MIAIIIILVAIELIYHPRLDVTRDGDWILWYGNKNRKYFKF